jgi:hypothetical protein
MVDAGCSRVRHPGAPPRQRRHRQRRLTDVNLDAELRGIPGMDDREAAPPPAETPGRLWRETLERLTAWLEAQGLDFEQARDLSESVVIVCALREAPRSSEHAFRLAIDQAARMR